MLSNLLQMFWMVKLIVCSVFDISLRELMDLVASLVGFVIEYPLYPSTAVGLLVSE